MSSSITSFTPLPSSLLNDYNLDKLIGNYTLQLVSISDISVPQYNSENEFLRVEEEPEEGEIDETLKGKQSGFKSTQLKKPDYKKKANRMLCLNLSDNKNIVKAIEYRPIPSLKPDIPIGSKILIKGPVDVSFKVLLLKCNNIQVIGPPSPGSTLPVTKSTDRKPSIDSLVKLEIKESPESKPLIKSHSNSVTTNGNHLSSIKTDPDRSIVDLSSTIEEDQMYYLEGLDDEILE